MHEHPNFGRPPSPPETRRSHRVQIMCTEGEYADLATLATAWDQPVSTIAWAVVRRYLTSLRAEGADADSRHPPIVQAASRIMLDDSAFGRALK